MVRKHPGGLQGLGFTVLLAHTVPEAYHGAIGIREAGGQCVSEALAVGLELELPGEPGQLGPSSGALAVQMAAAQVPQFMPNDTGQPRRVALADLLNQGLAHDHAEVQRFVAHPGKGLLAKQRMRRQTHHKVVAKQVGFGGLSLAPEECVALRARQQISDADGLQVERAVFHVAQGAFELPGHVAHLGNDGGLILCTRGVEPYGCQGGHHEPPYPRAASFHLGHSLVIDRISGLGQARHRVSPSSVPRMAAGAAHIRRARHCL